MAHVQIAREDRKKQPKAAHKVAAGDTLESIAKKADYKLKSWHELALYNWGTVAWKEVNRALLECVGCSTIKEDPGKTVLAPRKGETPEILLPKPWASIEVDGKGELALDKLHVLKLRSLRPANAIKITKLDKWFIPSLEPCDIEYLLEGLKETADKVELAVYGSNYCECTDWNKGLGTYTALPDTPVFEQTAGNPAEERKSGAILVPAAGGKKKKKEKWTGQTSTSKGILGVKPKGKQRHINVAFSPYTVLLRYYKDKGDAKASLTLLPFWPLWEDTKTEVNGAGAGADADPSVTITWDNAAKADRGALVIEDKDGQVVQAMPLPTAKLAAGAGQTMAWNKKYRAGAVNSRMKPAFLAADKNYKYKLITFVSKPKADSLKVEWLVKNTERLERGTLVIFDASGAEVFRVGLPKAKLAKSKDDKDKRDFTWDGKYSHGATNSLGGDSIIPEDMPYRVQLQAHTGTGEANGLALAAMHTEVRLAVHPKTMEATDPAYSWLADSASLTLSLGPAYTGPTPSDKTKDLWAQIKLTEAGYYPGPVRGGAHAQYELALKEFQRSVPKNNAAPFERLTVDGTYNADTRTALDALAAARRRPKFSDPSNANLAPYADSTANDLDTLSGLVRTRTRDLILWVDARHFYTDAGGDQADVKIDNYHGAMDNADGLVTVDATSTCRPWIPLVASLRLLSKEKALSDPLAAEPTDAKEREAMANAIGPLRVDWTFDEIGPDLTRVNTAAYKKQRVRTLRFLQWTLKTTSTLYTRKDISRKVLYTNCPKANGGIRDAAADYYQAAFGFGDDESLWPWPAVADSTTESIASIVHDHLVDSQPKDDEPLYAEWRGRAGVYFCPSTIAGDGYRVRAQVRFAKAGTDYEFPNVDALAGRYPRLPQAHTAALRLWRRSSVRCILSWSTGAPDHISGMNAFYHPSHVHMVSEAEATATDFKTYQPLDLIDSNAQQTAFKAVITGKVAQNYHKNHPEKIKFDNGNCYPYYDENDMGWPWPSAPGAANAKALIAEVDTDTWRTFRYVYIYNLVRRVEEKYGKLRGHVVVPFNDTPAYYAQRYACDKCNNTYWYLDKNAAGGTHAAKNCDSGCGGKMREGRCRSKYRCSRPACNHLTGWKGPDTWPGGGKWNGTQCPNCNQMTLQLDGAPQVQLAKQVVAAPRSIVNAGVGCAGGGTWLPDSFTPWEWAHEVGHHRHLEHAGDAPVGSEAQRTKLHDTETNTLPAANFDAADTAANERWDRCCVMSYVDSSPKYDNTIDLTYFCGKCVLRNAGWKVEAIKDSANKTGPGGNQNDD